MPLYEYQCGRCGRFEVIRKFSDEPLTVCPTCGQEIQKLLSAPAIQFKGTGWYITDYARKSSGEKSKDGASGKDASPSTESGAAKDGGASKDGGGGKDKGTSPPAAAAAGKSETTSTATKTAKSGSS